MRRRRFLAVLLARGVAFVALALRARLGRAGMPGERALERLCAAIAPGAPDLPGAEALGAERRLAQGVVADAGALLEEIARDTSLDEAFGQMMLEAAACSLPIVAFNIGGVTDICRDGVNALLAPAGDTEALLKATEFFVRDPATRERFGNEGRKIAVENFSLARQAENWTRYLVELAKS